jgi:hypothetical protein
MEKSGEGMEDDLIYDADFYRKRAEEARQNAVKAISRERRDEYLGLAIEWDQLAADVEANSSEKAGRSDGA